MTTADTKPFEAFAIIELFGHQRIAGRLTEAAGVPYFFKQWGEYLPICQEPAPARVADRLDWHHGRDSVVLQRDGRIEFAFPEGAMTCVRMGKREAGRQLDGRTWDEYPACAPR